MLVGEAAAAGRSVVVEGVLSDEFREELAVEARRGGAKVIHVECECADQSVHQTRVRDRFSHGESSITWELVSQNKVRYRSHPAPHYIADAGLPVDVNISAVISLLEG